MNMYLQSMFVNKWLTSLFHSIKNSTIELFIQDYNNLYVNFWKLNKQKFKKIRKDYKEVSI